MLSSRLASVKKLHNASRIFSWYRLGNSMLSPRIYGAVRGAFTFVSEPSEMAQEPDTLCGILRLV
jgi:hypothetical protein